MGLKDKLNVVISPGRISLQPNRRLVSSLAWYAGIIAVVAIFLAIFYVRIGEAGRIVCYALMIYFVGHGLVDYMFRFNVRYEFDRETNAVYKENPPFGRKRLMALDEIVIFTRSSSGEWHYAMGKKKQHLIRSYKVSPAFGGGKAQEQLAAEFEETILHPIMALVPAPL
ncbi:hypothetical protein HF324_08945 [Chitinophaga oryzae]|uniref:YcxB-like protein domain-containing protein n=1 Tax=Chitinophaga oryzae TaxID=2725414 RepID=A0ABX6LDX0_9BACT|nr:hypothetical protein [Chitinophaga oryzae]QJB37968.1 hypothetical protein HF324_08945 [Chitinophaga oryzae]